MASSLATFGRRLLRLLGAAVLVAGLGALGWLGWQWHAHTTVARVAVHGAQHAPADTLRRLARVDSGATMRSLAPELLADRVAHHPWVATATVDLQRLSGTVALTVAERTPAALALDSHGRPAFYLDAAGYRLPLVDSLDANVPLVRGLTPNAPTRRPAPPALQEVLQALASTGEASTGEAPTSEATGPPAPLVSAVEWRRDNTVWLVTRPFAAHGAVRVRLDAENAARQLRHLRAFARHVLAQPLPAGRAPIAEVDLRFDGQIVTRPAARGARESFAIQPPQ